jgi:hypothetical protein
MEVIIERNFKIGDVSYLHYLNKKDATRTIINDKNENMLSYSAKNSPVNTIYAPDYYEHCIKQSFSIHSVVKYSNKTDYIMIYTGFDLKILDKQLNLKTTLAADKFYYFDDECFAVYAKANNTCSFYDANIKLLSECIGEIGTIYQSVCKMGSMELFNYRTGEKGNLVVVKRYFNQELCAEITSDKTTRFIIRPVVFSETECAVCMAHLKERWCSVPCGHTNTCGPCLANMFETKKSCCICRKPITNIVKLCT